MVAKSSYVGQLIAGRFEVAGELGGGASGTVWLARDRVLGIPVALKVLRSTLRLKSSRRAAFEREARLCERMLSPHIVRALASGVHEGDVPYIAYELLRGASLTDRLVDGPLSLDEVERVTVQVARGLARAHALGVVHCDIKPCNIFLTADDRDRLLVKILDFGIARLGAHAATEGALYGTIEYMAPEVVLGHREAGAQADLYALAAVAYECLTGRPPFEAETVQDVVVRIAVGPHEPASVASFTGVDAAWPLDAWFRRGLALDPRARFASPSDLADELRDALEGARPHELSPLATGSQKSSESRIIAEAQVRLAAGEQVPALRPPRSGFTDGAAQTHRLRISQIK